MSTTMRTKSPKPNAATPSPIVEPLEHIYSFYAEDQPWAWTRLFFRSSEVDWELGQFYVGRKKSGEGTAQLLLPVTIAQAFRWLQAMESGAYESQGTLEVLHGAAARQFEKAETKAPLSPGTPGLSAGWARPEISGKPSRQRTRAAQ